MAELERSSWELLEHKLAHMELHRSQPEEHKLAHMVRRSWQP